MKDSNKNELIVDYASRSANCLRRAFNRRTPQIAENLTALDKPMSARTVRRMTEESSDVRRRNILENTCLLLGAAFLASPKIFDTIWQFLSGYAQALRGPSIMHGSVDAAFLDLRFATIEAERKYLDGAVSDVPKALILIEEALRSLFVHVQLRT